MKFHESPCDFNHGHSYALSEAKNIHLTSKFDFENNFFSSNWRDLWSTLSGKAA